MNATILIYLINKTMGFGRKNGNSSFVMTLKMYCNFKGPINTVEIKNTDTDYSVWIHIKLIPILIILFGFLSSETNISVWLHIKPISIPIIGLNRLEPIIYKYYFIFYRYR